jgi:hypothetical protein
MNFDAENGPAGQAYKLLVGLVAPRRGCAVQFSGGLVERRGQGQA